MRVRATSSNKYNGAPPPLVTFTHGAEMTADVHKSTVIIPDVKSDDRADSRNSFMQSDITRMIFSVIYRRRFRNTPTIRTVLR